LLLAAPTFISCRSRRIISTYFCHIISGFIELVNALVVNRASIIFTIVVLVKCPDRPRVVQNILFNRMRAVRRKILGREGGSRLLLCRRVVAKLRYSHIDEFHQSLCHMSATNGSRTRRKLTIFLIGEVDLKFGQIASDLESGQVGRIRNGQLDRKRKVDPLEDVELRLGRSVVVFNDSHTGIYGRTHE
jgi:hypothetical protein